MAQIDALKHKYLPQVVMSDDFESEWAQYKEEYGKIDSQVYFDELTEEVRRKYYSYPGGAEDFHTMYIGEIVSAYIIREA